jgi:hypothetical protein
LSNLIGIVAHHGVVVVVVVVVVVCVGDKKAGVAVERVLSSEF